jgi:hypothetical protein
MRPMKLGIPLVIVLIMVNRSNLILPNQINAEGQNDLTVGRISHRKTFELFKVKKHRMGLESAEKKRVNAAFELLDTGPPPAISKGAKQRLLYLEFANMKDS